MQPIATTLGDKAIPLDSQEIANIQILKNPRLINRQFLQVDVDLDSTTDIAEVKELALAHVPVRRDPTRHADPRALLETLSDLTDSTGDIETLSEGIHFQPKQLLQLLSANRQKIVFFHDSRSGVRSCGSSEVAEVQEANTYGREQSWRIDC